MTIVHTKSGTLLTKKFYADWRAVQDEFDDYMTSLGPFEPSELVEYLATAYPVDSPFADDAIGEFLESDDNQNSNYCEELAAFSGLDDR